MTSSPFSSECPLCGQRAPIVLRGLESRCSACGGSRFPLAAPNVQLAGQPSRVGGIAASIAGWSVLVLGLSLSAGLWLLLQAIWPGSLVSWAFGLPAAVASLLFGVLLLLGGSRLRRSGVARRDQVQLQAVKALVDHRKGPIRAADVARALELPEADVDQLLTRLARQQATAVTVDVDADGHVVYDFEGEERRWRVLDEQADAEGAASRSADSVEPAQRAKR